jgi:hypothetical protein
LGSLLEVRAGQHYQAAIIRGQSTHFGLGQATQADVVRILWPNGIPLNRVAAQADQVLCEEALPIGSCPYLYLWNGERFEFCTDLLWNAPLGLKFAEDVVAPWREWEYLKLDGDKLQPKDGAYVLQVTEELWEIGYFDLMELMAIDHPLGTEIFTNEKVAPPDQARHTIHTVSTRRRPLVARDGTGRDVLGQVTNTDGEFARTAQQRLSSGLVTENVLELDFGDLGDPQRVMLFLTGWLFPTDTSLNVQFSQHPTLPRPRPPALWTVNDQGEWRESRAFLGFPGGKTKTIAVDITDAINLHDARLRIVTNMEFDWDAAFLTVDEPAVEIIEHSTPLLGADLHFRGCSQAVQGPGGGPETYDYDQPITHPKWPPLAGRLTRYGDVTDLLARRDDQLVVLGSGDELTVRFAALPPPKAGFVRDFVLHNVGWDKDAVLNTVFGSTVEPMPFEAMTAYGELRPRDEVYQRYLDDYQTREQGPENFWNLVRRPRTAPFIPNARWEP